MTVGYDVFGYTGFTTPTIGMNADWTDYPVSTPTLYQHCLSDSNFPGWSYAIPEGETHLDQLTDPMRNDDASAIQVPEGWTVTLYKHGADGSGDDKHELIGPTKVECFTTIGLNDAITTIVAANTGGGGGGNGGDEDFMFGMSKMTVGLVGAGALVGIYLLIS